MKETKEKAMIALSPYKMSGSHDYVLDGNTHSQQSADSAPQTFVSLLEFVSEIYEVSIVFSHSHECNRSSCI